MPLRALFLLLCILASQSSRAQSMRAELLAQVQAQGQFFTLGEVARVHGATTSALHNLVLGRAPRMGYTLELSREAIEAQVARLAPSTRVLWSGAHAIKIRAKGQRVTAAKIADAAAMEAFHTHGEAYPSLELRIVGEVEDLWIPQGQALLKTRVQPMHAIGKRLCVWVDIHLDGKPYRSVPVWFEPKALRPVMVAKSQRAIGEALRPADFDVKSVDVAALASAPMEANEIDTATLRLKQTLAAGAPLLRTQVEARPAVNRQQDVLVKVQEGPIVIQSTGVAMADARVGAVVRVMNPRSKDHFMAKVVGDGVVLIEGGSR